jgi:hypothetical protein
MIALYDILFDAIEHKIPSCLATVELNFLKELLLDKPEVFAKISAGLKEIMADGKIDLHDVPQIILLIATIYNANVIPDIALKINMNNIIQFTIDAILDSGILPLPQFEVDIIKRVVDSCMHLLKTNPNLAKKETEACHSCFTFFC